MVNFYVNMISNGRITLDRVPQKWFEAVKAELEKTEANGEGRTPDAEEQAE